MVALPGGHHHRCIYDIRFQNKAKPTRLRKGAVVADREDRVRGSLHQEPEPGVTVYLAPSM